MKIERSESYEEPALEWLYRETARLREVLLSARVSESVARSICEEFIFRLAGGLDDEPVLVGQSQWVPALVFLSGGTALLPDLESFAWHDYAFGVTGEVFEAN